MKKLVDETTDELTRSLLIAGIEHRPPPGNKAQLLVALGAGGAMGLFSAKAFGWMGTSAGKVTIVSMALGVAGAVYGVAPLLMTESDPGTAGAVAIDEARSPAVPSEPAEPSEVMAPLSPAPVERPALAPRRESPAAVAAFPLVGSRAGEGDSVELLVKPKRASRKPRAEARTDQSVVPVPADTAPAVDALAEERQPEESKTTNERSRLESEVALVDEMHWAARHNDREALGRFVEAYRLQFPDGQLEAEVAAFAARLERPAPAR